MDKIKVRGKKSPLLISFNPVIGFSTLYKFKLNLLMKIVKSSLILVSLIISSIGCSNSKVEPSPESEHNTTVWLLSKYGESDSPLAQELKERLLSRLLGGANIVSPNIHKPIRMFFLRTDTPSAFSQCNGSIFLTEGLITAVPSLAELSSIISHEIAHIYRGDACNVDTNDDGNVVYSTHVELEADKLATKILLASFIDPRYLSSAIQTQYRLFSGSEAEKVSVKKRIDRLNEVYEHIPEVKTKFSEDRIFNKLRGSVR